MMHPDIIGVRTLIFDMDGTLIRSSKIAKKAIRFGYEEFHRQHGVEPPALSDEALIANIGAPSDDFYENLLQSDLKPEWKTFRDLVHGKEREFLETHRITFPGTVQTLKLLRKRGYKMALVSNCNAPHMEAVLKTQKLAEYFDLTLCISAYDGATKSSLIADVVKKLGGPAVVIGDRFYDIEAAKANDLPSIGALYGYGNREELMGTATWVEDIRELQVLLFPLRELADRIAAKIQEVVSIKRPISVAVNGPHFSLTTPLASLIITELIDRKTPVSHIPMESHRTRVQSDDPAVWVQSSYPFARIDQDVLAACKTGKVNVTLAKTQGIDAGKERPYRSRPGGVVVVEGSFLLNGTLHHDFDFSVNVTADDTSVRHAIRRNRREEADFAIRRGESKNAAKDSADAHIAEDLELWDSVYRNAVHHYSNDSLEATVTVDGTKLEQGRLVEPD